MLTLSGRDGATYDGSVVHLGTLSKEPASGSRIGWVVAAPDRVRALVATKQGSDIYTSGLCQRIAHDAFAGGVTDRILANILAFYRTRRDALRAAMKTHLGELLVWEVPIGGLFVWATARDPSLDTDALLECRDGAWSGHQAIERVRPAGATAGPSASTSSRTPR